MIARVLDAGVGGAALPLPVGLEHDPLPLDADGHAVLDEHAGEADARDVAGSDDAGQEVELAVRVPGRCRG